MPIGDISAEIILNLIQHQITIQTDTGHSWQIPLVGQSTQTLYTQLQTHFAAIGVQLDINTDKFTSDSQTYTLAAARQLWSMQAQVVSILSHLKSSFRHESSPIQLWPHHFDISLVWLSGNLIDGQDPADAEHADEQMSFGFGTGDGLVNEPYFYANAYPMPDGLIAMCLCKR